MRLRKPRVAVSPAAPHFGGIIKHEFLFSWHSPAAAHPALSAGAGQSHPLAPDATVLGLPDTRRRCSCGSFFFSSIFFFLFDAAWNKIDGEVWIADFLSYFLAQRAALPQPLVFKRRSNCASNSVGTNVFPEGGLFLYLCDFFFLFSLLLTAFNNDESAFVFFFLFGWLPVMDARLPGWPLC